MRAVLALSTFLVAGAAPYETVPTGDGGGVVVRVENRNVHPTTARLGGAELPVTGFGSGTFHVQCAGDDPPRLRLVFAGAEASVQVASTSFSEPPPVLWISDARRGRAALEAIVRPVSGSALKHLAPGEVPTLFAGLRFAPLLLVSAGDLARLPAAAREAVRGAVLAGSTLVVGTGDAAGPPDGLAQLAAIRLGSVAPPGPALGEALPNAPTARGIEASGPGVVVRVEADGAPVILEAALGLGRVRVLTTSLKVVGAGPVADVAFARDDAALVQALSWMDGAPPLAQGERSIFALHVWALLAVLPLLGLIARRRPRWALMLAVPWLAAAVVVPPAATPTEAESARILYIGSEIAIGTFDVRLGRGGPVDLATPVPAALEAARRGGACLVQGETGAWSFHGEPGDRRRVAFLARLPAPAVGPDQTRPLEGASWPTGPLVGRRIIGNAGLRLPLERLPAKIEGFLATPPTLSGVAPRVLAAPTPPTY